MSTTQTAAEASAQISRNLETIQKLVSESRQLADAHNLPFSLKTIGLATSSDVSDAVRDAYWDSSSNC